MTDCLAYYAIKAELQGLELHKEYKVNIYPRTNMVNDFNERNTKKNISSPVSLCSVNN